MDTTTYCSNSLQDSVLRSSYACGSRDRCAVSKRASLSFILLSVSFILFSADAISLLDPELGTLAKPVAGRLHAAIVLKPPSRETAGVLGAAMGATFPFLPMYSA